MKQGPGAAATLTGRCHCGNLEVSFETGRRPADLTLRACACSFCRRHGARCVSDPEGAVRITVRDQARLTRYRFGLETADFLVCGACGVYLGAVITAGDSAYATLNINTFDAPEAFGAEAVPIDYDREGADQRRARRKAKWTPVLAIVEGSV